MDYSELDVEGVGIIMADCAIVYKAQGYLGEELTVAVAAGDFSRIGCDLFYRLSKADGSEVARAKTGIVFFDYQAQAARPVPAGFRRQTSGI
jgi:4-hydroxybenzoyl-CoA thioesterase